MYREPTKIAAGTFQKGYSSANNYSQDRSLMLKVQGQDKQENYLLMKSLTRKIKGYVLIATKNSLLVMVVEKRSYM